MTEIETLLNESLDKRAYVEAAESKYNALASFGYMPESTLHMAKGEVSKAKKEHEEVLAKLVPLFMALDDKSLIEIMMMRFVEGKTVKEIAEAKFLCPSQVYKKIKKARGTLAKNTVHSNAT